MGYFSDYARSFTGFFAIRHTSDGGTFGEEKIRTAWVSGNYFRVSVSAWRVAAALLRTKIGSRRRRP